MTEKELLRHIHAISHRTGFQDTGGDVAIVADRVHSTDQFIEGTHFTWDQMTPQELGFKAVTQALSDLSAAASPPLALLCSAAWPREREAQIVEVFGGIEEACHFYKVPLVGGDVSRAPNTYFDFSVVGRHLLTPGKSGAKPGDRIAVTGFLGSAAGGLIALKQKLSFLTLIEAFKRPVTPLQQALKLAQTGQVHALTDISDSLAKSLYDISQKSQCGAQIFLNQLPVLNELKDLCAQRNHPWSDLALYGGEDYQLLVILDSNTSENLISDHGLVVIGTITEGSDVVIVNDGHKEIIKEAGWDPFDL